jgi:2-haloacid dehalogenase
VAGVPAKLHRLKACAFDAYGTLFDVFSVTALCEELFPGKGTALAGLWRVKQLQYSLLRSLMGRHRDFWQLTEDGLVYASKSLNLELTLEKREQLMDAYLKLTAFPDVRPGLEVLKQHGLRLALLSNGAPRMLEPRRGMPESWTCSTASSASRTSGSSSRVPGSIAEASSG